MKRTFSCLLLVIGASVLYSQQKKLPVAVPSRQQLQWHEMEFYLFAHFGPNTFTDKEWGLGDEPEDVFNPAKLDCDHWCRIAKAAGAKGIIITAKHHDGFCLWPSKFSTHTVRESKWKNGKGDVLKELSAACKRHGLKFGVYISPWDRNHPKYGTAAYNDVFINMMKEIFQNYGPIWELWWDGANGEGPNGKKQAYDWKRFEKTVRQLSPATVIFSDIGPDIRWVGNEKGIAGETNWNLLDTAGFKRGEGAPPTDTLNQGNLNGKNWIPAECDVSIRPGWFYHPKEDDAVKSPEELFELYLKSVGRGANLLLNVPPNRNGLIDSHDSLSLIRFKNLRQQSFSKNLLPLKQDTILAKRAGAEFISYYRMREPGKINCVVLMENIEQGQKIHDGTIIFELIDSVANSKNSLQQTLSFTTVGRKRIITFPAINANMITIRSRSVNGIPVLKYIGAYLIDENLIERKTK
jgi:alpha-L-fucosidase